MAWEIREFQRVYSDFYAGCETELKAEIDERLRVLRRLGNDAREPYSKFVEDGIFECRANSIRHHARLLFCFQPQQKIVIVVCVIKKKRKLDRADIELAKKRKAIVNAEREMRSGLHTKH